jgi:Putative MetA-pathway of phenol degradation
MIRPFATHKLGFGATDEVELELNPAQRAGRFSARRAWVYLSIVAWAFIALFFAAPSLAGPPFLTDDPVPVDYQHWEINNYASSNFAKGASFTAAPGSDINYGILPNVQAHVNVSLATNFTNGIGTSFGPADLELGVKYRFLDAKPEDWWPQIAFYPFVDLPTGDASRGLGTGSVHSYLPIWIEKDFGKWTAYGGGGYWINPGPGNRDFWFTGWVLLRQITDSLQLGGEIFHQTRSSTSAPPSPGFPIGTKDTTGFNLGGTYDFDKTFHLLFSAGTGLQNAESSNEFSFYLALRVTF